MAKIVKTENLADGDILARDIYINSGVLFQAGTYVTPALIYNLLELDIGEVAVNSDSALLYQDWDDRHISSNKLRTLKERFQNDMKPIANELRCGHILHSESSYQWLRSIYLHFFSNPAVRLLMDSLKQWDPVCYIHSIDVFVFLQPFQPEFP
ncbi:hypothetical protein [Sporolactobacillus pectinivorans]|uniref:hypothetical protein n=1 Tax=Sporolactobacillus pectinivorans TaxID=1591408 RepID=UPI001EFCB271|nr:hypothetical protein [Sporolactobacillus pectinivorans]